jgi:hypothetical protein
LPLKVNAGISSCFDTAVPSAIVLRVWSGPCTKSGFVDS